MVALGLSATAHAAIGDPKDSGKWQLIAKDAFGQKTFMDTAHFEAGFPAPFSVKSGIGQCHGKYPLFICTRLTKFASDSSHDPACCSPIFPYICVTLTQFITPFR